MSDAKPDPRLPVPNKPGGYLPRLSYKEVDPAGDTYGVADPEPDQAGKSAASEAKNSKPGAGGSRTKAEAPDEPDAPKRILKEATPELDTIEARQRIRMIVGIVATLIVLAGGALVFQFVSQSTEPEPLESPVAAPSTDAGAETQRRETIAAQLLEEARSYAEKQQVDQAVQRLERLTATLANTQASNEARAALDRHKRRLPLFPTGEVVATAPPPVEPPTETKSEPPKIVVAPTITPPPETAPATKAVTLAPPLVPAEDYRETSLPRERADVPARALPEGFRPREQAGVHPSSWPNEITCDRDGSAMVLVPAGAFVMGNDQGRPAERPEHQVTLGTYYVDQHEVTNRQYDHFLKATSGTRKDADSDAEAPLVRVTWDEAKEFATWVGKSVPTEAQWEKAARATDRRLFPWGSDKPSWNPPRAPKQIDAVCTYAGDLSPYGAFDMSGNAWEWTADWFEARAYQASRGAPRVDPRNAEKPSARIPEVAVRGGSADWDITWRSGMRADTRAPYLGFRCVLEVEAAAAPAGAPANAPAGRTPATKDERKIVPF